MPTYPNLEAFYSDNETRRRSPEADYGVWWINESPFPRWRISYVQDTGEVYGVEQSFGPTEVFAVVPPDEEGLYYTTLDALLEGWPERCGELNGLAWIRERLGKYLPTS